MAIADDYMTLTRVGPGTPMGNLHSALLDSGGHVGATHRARRRAGAYAPARRKSRRVPRSPRQAWIDRRVLPASRRIASLWAQRRGRVALPLSWLEDQRAGRDHRDAGGEPKARSQKNSATPIIRCARPADDRLDLYRTARQGAGHFRAFPGSACRSRIWSSSRCIRSATICRAWRAISIRPRNYLHRDLATADDESWRGAGWQSINHLMNDGTPKIHVEERPISCASPRYARRRTRT